MTVEKLFNEFENCLAICWDDTLSFPVFNEGPDGGYVEVFVGDIHFCFYQHQVFDINVSEYHIEFKLNNEQELFKVEFLYARHFDE